jgi:heme/copper-type cytochrome/quinol oxidase subunit 2
MVRIKTIVLAALIVVTCSLVLPLLARPTGDGERRTFDIKARQYAFDPPRICVDQGDEVHIRLASLDVVHGFFLEGYDVDALIEPGKAKFKMRHPSKGEDYKEVKEIVFRATRRGKFRYRCSHTCGTLHPFMQGELIVRPNYLFLAAVGGTAGIVLATFVVLCLTGGGMGDHGKNEKDRDGTR